MQVLLRSGQLCFYLYALLFEKHNVSDKMDTQL